MDNFDRDILDIVQRDNHTSHAKIGEAVNLSASSVRRRLLAMEKNGTIVGNVALTDLSKFGFTFIVQVEFREDQNGADCLFRPQMLNDDAVSQCYHVAGDFDYVLVVHAQSLEAYEQWGQRALAARTDVRRFSSFLVWQRTKFSTVISPAEFQ